MQGTIEAYKSIVEKNNLRITVFMLTHNREHYLKLAMEAVLRQTYSNFVFWILDNQSVDNTAEMIKGFTDERLLYSYRVSKPEDSNVNFAHRICCTPYHVILHDDDIVEDNYLEEMVACMEAGEYDMLSCDTKVMDEDGNIQAFEPTEAKTTWGEIITFREKEYLYHIYGAKRKNDDPYIHICYPSVVYRTEPFWELWQKTNRFSNGKFSTGPAGDLYIYMTVERYGGTIGILNKKLLRYRVHSTQAGSVNRGFMSLRLIGFLAQDEYYRTLFRTDKRLNEAIRKDVFKNFAVASNKYSRGDCPKENYKAILTYGLYSALNSTLKGRLLYASVFLLIKIPFIPKAIFAVIRRLRKPEA